MGGGSSENLEGSSASSVNPISSEGKDLGSKSMNSLDLLAKWEMLTRPKRLM